MRVVVDYGHAYRLPRPAAPLAPDAERVVVVRPGAEGSRESIVPAGSAARSIPGEGDARTTDEAKLLDRSVRAHEREHQFALGPYASSGIQLATRRGADGEAIAVGGRIRADLTPVPGDPRATLRKANAVRRAALAPGSPSAADMRVAAEAYRLARDAAEELQTHYVDTSA